MHKKIICLLIVFTLLSINVFSFAATKQELQNQQADIESNKSAAEEELEQVKTELSETMQEVQKLSQSILENEAKLEEINLKLQNLQNEIDKTKQKLQEAEANYAKQKDTLEERIIAQYKAGKTSYLDVLLNSTSLSDFISNYYLVGKIAKYDDQLLDEIEEEKEKITKTKTDLEEKESTFKVEKAKQEKTNVVLKNSKAQKDTYVTRLSEDEKALQQKIDEYDTAMLEVERQLKQFQNQNTASSSSGTGFVAPSGNGQLLWPLPGYSGRSSSYGMRYHPITGVWKMHTGIDIPAPSGTPILAAESGIVVTAGWNSGGYGNYVIIYHGGTTYTLYGHCVELYVTAGEKVTRGQTIAGVGTTGSSTGNHLHFEVRIDGTHHNPMDYV